MPRLECRVLPVVGEAKKLARIKSGILRKWCGEMLTQYRQGEHSGGGGTAFPRETGEAVDVPSMGLVLVTAAETEAEFARDKPVSSATAAVPPLIDRFIQWLGVLVVGLHFVSRCPLLDPRIREVLQAT
ncbi:MAG: hypothetical protein WCJ63_09215, partial [Actinomycetes bacterium]